MASIPDEDRGELMAGFVCVDSIRDARCSRSFPSPPNAKTDVEYDPQAVAIIRQNWIDKQLKKR
jgi:hypothetical protein